MYELTGTGVIMIDFRPGDYRTDFEGAVRRPEQAAVLAHDMINTARMSRAWSSFVALMRSGPAPAHAAESLRRTLLRGRSGTVRTGRFFQAQLGPFLARFGTLAFKRKMQEKYFGL